MTRNQIRVGLLAAMAIAGGPALAAEDAPQASDARGLIHGTVRTRGDKVYTGVIRWGTEEAFWDDLFNATKTDLPDLKQHAGDRRRRKTVRIFGVTLGYAWESEDASRQFVVRFGDIREIHVLGNDKIEVTTKDGVLHRLDGGSNDVGAEVVVQDRSLGAVTLAWDRIERVEFGPAPAGTPFPAVRLFGRVVTSDETFEGFIQWDSQECLGSDRLDGESEDGAMAIEMGRIRAIEKHDDDGAWVELKDGRRLLLEDTNDVDQSIRGILVEDPRFGRVEVSWKAFQRAEFRDAGRSGLGYDEFRAPRPLSGSATDQEGHAYPGKIVFDLDERASWEILNGSKHGVDYDIPFERIRWIEPVRGEASRVMLKNGLELTLEDGQDVSESNAGVLILREGQPETYLPWIKVKHIEFE